MAEIYIQHKVTCMWIIHCERLKTTLDLNNSWWCIILVHKYVIWDETKVNFKSHCLFPKHRTLHNLSVKFFCDPLTDLSNPYTLLHRKLLSVISTADLACGFMTLINEAKELFQLRFGSTTGYKTDFKDRDCVCQMFLHLSSMLANLSLYINIPSQPTVEKLQYKLFSFVRQLSKELNTSGKYSAKE